jgi:hypothetical protein
MRTHKWADIKARKFTPEKLAEIQQRVDADVLEMNLRALRESTGKTQEEIAAAASMGQSEVSRIERRDDYLLSTLRRYINALGGELEITAILGDKRITLHGV